MRLVQSSLRRGQKYKIEELNIDREFVEQRFKYEDGAFGHCISLPSLNDFKGVYKTAYNNVPQRGVLNHTPYFKEIYDSFKTEVTSFRLMRREANSSYGIHNDRDMGDDVVRFQIPIVQNNNCWLAITNLEMEEDWTEENSHDLRSFNKKFKPNFHNHKLEDGYIYTFDVTRNHSLFNEGDTDRITLLIDLKKNEWTEKILDTFKYL